MTRSQNLLSPCEAGGGDRPKGGEGGGSRAPALAAAPSTTLRVVPSRASRSAARSGYAIANDLAIAALDPRFAGEEWAA